MSTTVHDPVCHMDIDPATAAAHLDITARPITFVHLGARSPSIRTLKSISATPIKIRPLNRN